MKKSPFFLTLALLVFHASHAGEVEPSAAITLTSKPAATPKSPAVLADTTFTAAASGTGSLTYQWDFGDGTPQGSGASVVHAYSAAGSYTVVLTVTDGSGGSETSPLVITVTDAVKSPKLFITLNFKNSGRDTIFFQGQLRLPPAAKLDNQVFAVNVGGAATAFTLNSFGQASTSRGNSAKVFVKNRSDAADGLNAQFYVNLKGNFQAALSASANLTNRDADREPVKVKIALTLLSISYNATVTQEFDAKHGVKGITR